MIFNKKTLNTLIFFFTFTTICYAQNNDVKLESTIKKFNNYVITKNAEGLLKLLPPHLISAMSLRMGLSIDKLNSDFKNKIFYENNARIILDSKNINYGVTSSDLKYAIIPTVVSSNTQRINTQTLAIFENNNWYLIYGGVKASQNPILSLIYPSIDEVHFKADTVVNK